MDLYTGHEAEIEAEDKLSAEQVALSYLRSAIEALDPSCYLDFMPAPTKAQMIERALEHAKTAIKALSGAKGD